MGDSNNNPALHLQRPSKSLHLPGSRATTDSPPQPRRAITQHNSGEPVSGIAPVMMDSHAPLAKRRLSAQSSSSQYQHASVAASPLQRSAAAPPPAQPPAPPPNALAARGRRNSSVFGNYAGHVALASQVGRTGTQHMGHERVRGGPKVWGVANYMSTPAVPYTGNALQTRRASVNVATLISPSVLAPESDTEDEEHGLLAHKSLHDLMAETEQQGVMKNKRLNMSRRKRRATRATMAASYVLPGSLVDRAENDDVEAGPGAPIFGSGGEGADSWSTSDASSDAEPEVSMSGFQLYKSTFFQDGTEGVEPVELPELQPEDEEQTVRSRRSAKEDAEQIQLTKNQLRLTYLIGLFTPDDAHKGDEWIRLLPIVVLIYEGVLDGVFDYNYSPSPVHLHGKQVYLNLCQEGLDDLNTLRKAGLLKALKVTSETYVHSTAFRLAPNGLRHLRSQLTPDTKICVQRFASVKLPSADGKNSRELLKVLWQAEEFCFYMEGCISGTYLRSSITDVEAISYVLSPYMPAHYKIFDCPSSSMADRVPEVVAVTAFEVHAPDFHALTLANVRLMLSEWVPMGGNAIVALNDRLGVSERVQGGFFTAAVDKHPAATLYQGALNGLTSVRPLDYDEYSHVNFEAEVFFPTEPGTVQLESFSVHCSEDGHVMFGGLLEVTTGCGKEAISADVLSRLLIDLSLDSSEVITNLFNSHQQDMLNCVLLDEPQKRDKFGIIMADAIKPCLKAEDVLQKGAAENKVRSVVGDIKSALDIKEGHLLVVGRSGLLLCGPDSTAMEPVALLYAQCEARSIFLKSIFSRCYIVVDILNQAHVLLQNFASYPENLEHLRAILAAVSEDILLLQEVQRSMLDSITGLQELNTETLQGEDQLKVADFLAIPLLIHSLRKRAIDLQKTITGCKHDMAAMQQMLGVIEESQRLKLSAGLRDNTKNLEELFRDEARNTTSLEIINVVFAGSLAFQALDRITGSYLGISLSIDWISVYVRPFITGVPFVYLALNLVAWGMLAGFIFVLMRVSTYMANRLETLHAKVVIPVDGEALQAFLASKQLKHQGVEMDSAFQINKYAWQEPGGGIWRNIKPKFDLEVDNRNGYLLGIATQVHKGAGEHSLRRANILLGVQLHVFRVMDFDQLQTLVLEDDADGGDKDPGDAGAVACLTDMVRTWKLPAEYLDVMEKLIGLPGNKALAAGSRSASSQSAGRKAFLGSLSSATKRRAAAPSAASTAAEPQLKPTMTTAIRSLSNKMNTTLSRAFSSASTNIFSSWAPSNAVIPLPSGTSHHSGTTHPSGRSLLAAVHDGEANTDPSARSLAQPNSGSTVGGSRRRNKSIRRIARRSLDQRPPTQQSERSAAIIIEPAAPPSRRASQQSLISAEDERPIALAHRRASPASSSRTATTPAHLSPARNRSLAGARVSLDWVAAPAAQHLTQPRMSANAATPGRPPIAITTQPRRRTASLEALGSTSRSAASIPSGPGGQLPSAGGGGGDAASNARSAVPEMDSARRVEMVEQSDFFA